MKTLVDLIKTRIFMMINCNGPKKYGLKGKLPCPSPQPRPAPMQIFDEERKKAAQNTLLSYFTSTTTSNDPWSPAKDEQHAPFDGNRKESKQLYLRLGQKENFLTECRECFMAYNPSCVEDRKIHSKYHKKCSLK